MPDEPATLSSPDTEAIPPADHESIPDYYDDTIEDYQSWSKEGYLHYGYWRPWLNPFRRRPMLEEMNRLVFRLLGLGELDSGSVADLGCGFGAVSRFGSQQFPKLQFHAMTLSPNQVSEARRRHQDERVEYYCGDYHELPFEDQSIDRVFFLESMCHSTQPETALREAARVLKPGGRIVLTDGYLQRPYERCNRLFQSIVSNVADNWAVPMFHEIQLARKWNADEQLRLVDEFECGWRLGPSALHAAHLTLLHFFKLLWRRDTKPWQWKHLRASAFTIQLGLSRRLFRYHVLTFEKS